MKADRPIIPPDAEVRELTVRAVLLSVILAAVLAGANAYLGLFAGITVSASIPAAVVSMAVLRLLRRGTILENNIVQTAASSGEALAAGVIFTIPALLLVGYWEAFDYWQTTLIAAVGGLLGVLFTIPLRRALIITARLRFPEGVATAEVLKVGAELGTPRSSAGGSVKNVRLLVSAATVGAGAKFAESGLHLWPEAVEGAAWIGRTVVYAGINLSPALLAVGFIIGLHTALVVFIGGLIGWVILLPLSGWLAGVPPGLSESAAAKAVWSTQVRYVGIGAMLAGGLWTLTRLRVPVWESLQALRDSYRLARSAARSAPRTERDAPLPWLLVGLVLSVSVTAGIYAHVVGEWAIGIGMTLIMVVAAFLFSSVAGYMAGLVGSSSNPISGVTIATIMLAALLLVIPLGQGHPAGPAAALLIGAVVCCAAAMGGDNLQDLKTGHLVGATPWKQQIAQIIGVATGAIVLVPVLSLLEAQYGIGEVTTAHPHPLSAPQATLMASLTRSVFGGALPWHLVALGVLIGTAVIALDLRQERRGRAFRIPVLAVALGIYLPLKLSAAIMVGGVLAAAVARRYSTETVRRGGLLVAAGLITGEALMGILLAVPLALKGVRSIR
ncbi:OPT family oligopeptide transporter [Candidatus Nitrospira bockiana]